MWKTISRGKIWKGELKNKAKDGSIYWVDTIITPFLNERGKPYQYVATRFDITESKKAEGNIKKQNDELVIQNEEKKIRAAELILANKELAYQNGEKAKRADELILANLELEFQNGEKEKRATELGLSNKELLKTNTELDRFVYSVSHDLRSPITSILGLISFIEEDSREPETLEQVKMIRASMHRLDGFIKNILNYSLNNRTGLERQKIPIKKTIYEIVDSVCNIKGAEGISFEIDIDEKQPFYSDWQRFHTILENLISNGIKYHSKEVSGRYLKLTGTSDNEELKLSISDNGIGIEAAYHDKIFDMFYRLPGTKAGSGFGLYIVKETLEKLHGTIEIQSEKGVGTTFIISLKNLKE
jgi:signal transduction histidine kinase